MNKSALTLSAVLTAFVLILVGGVTYTVRSAKQVEAAQDAAPAAQSLDQPVELTLAQPLDAQTQQAILERDAAYQDLINQANARLVQTQQENQALQVQVSALTGGTAPGAGTTISAEQAAQIAVQFMGGGQVYTVQTITFDTSPAYQVAFNSGDVVVVGADGTVLAYYPPTPTPALSGVSGSVGAERRQRAGRRWQSTSRWITRMSMRVVVGDD
jgi:hypothetical protein